MYLMVSRTVQFLVPKGRNGIRFSNHTDDLESFLLVRKIYFVPVLSDILIIQTVTHLVGNNPSHPTRRIRRIAISSRYQVDVGMENCLTGRCATVHADVESGDRLVRFRKSGF